MSITAKNTAKQIGKTWTKFYNGVPDLRTVNMSAIENTIEENGICVLKGNL